ncbi:MAG: hypothetical protein K940chlam5_01735 [Candidatus Anoxychlamydiales bacterium]|nr:hypothetical protein [Candidatus Anoxychlamydiales bacterium]
MKLVNQCRVFLKKTNGQLKKIYSIRAYSKFFQAQVWSTAMCKALGLPLKSEIHYQYWFEERNLHLTIKYLIGCQPPAFSDYTNNDRIYCFPTISTPITAPTNESLKKNPWLDGDSTKSRPTKNDIVIDESIDPNILINVCGFVSSEAFYPFKEAVQWQSRTIVTPAQLQFGINVIFS